MPSFLTTFTRSFSAELLNFVPKHAPVVQTDVTLLEEFLTKAEKVVVLTGAGISTESGIPDYRSEEIGLYARSNHKPIQYHQFLKSSKVRQRYWARNYIGWERFSSCKPNDTHKFFRDLELVHKKADVIVTQNVDSLHYKAGSKNVIELHGTAFKVICLQCGKNYSRYDIQNRMKELNPTLQETSTMIRPDGDVEMPQDKIDEFIPPFCEDCRGILKPDIVFFGDNVPRQRVEAVKSCVTNCDSVLVCGSSLTVFSSYRIILQAVEENKNIAIVNIGPTRADNLVQLKISAKCGDILPKVVL